MSKVFYNREVIATEYNTIKVLRTESDSINITR